jgi:hypothetical protein
MNHEENLKRTTRRHFFCQCGTGIGVMALASLLRDGDIFAANADPAVINPLAPKPPHFAPKAKQIIYLFMAGAPSQLDLFDYKPRLKELQGQPIPASVVGDQRYAFIKRDAKLLGTPRQFSRHGKCGAELSDALPNLAKVVDDIAIIKSMHTEAFNHAPAEIFLQTGSQQFGRPSMGSWLTYGLGSEATDLPGFVVLSTGGGASGGASSWGSGFLPTTYQGVPFRGSGDPILSLSNPAGIDAQTQRESLNALRDLNHRRLGLVGDPEIATRINSFEMAYRMQSSAPELMDIAKESKETLELYGAKPGETSFANNCLLARRLIERGVRFVNVYHHGWDHHGGKDTDLVGGLNKLCGQTDQAVAGLIQDLKRRGLLETTLVIWGGEFGRTPMMQADNNKYPGRDHHPQAFTLWMAGAGVKVGQTLGATDDFGFHVVQEPVPVHDLQATILHLMGIDHKKLTFRFQGRDYRLTDVSGEVVQKLLA